MNCFSWACFRQECRKEPEKTNRGLQVILRYGPRDSKEALWSGSGNLGRRAEDLSKEGVDSLLGRFVGAGFEGVLFFWRVGGRVVVVVVVVVVLVVLVVVVAFNEFLQRETYRCLHLVVCVGLFEASLLDSVELIWASADAGLFQNGRG